MRMDAVKFVRERNRMCRTFDASCDGCPAFEDGCCDNVGWDEKIVSIVEAWARNHPPKTRQTKFLKQWPNASVDGGTLVLCPRAVDPTYTCPLKTKACRDCRKEYWSQEVE